DWSAVYGDACDAVALGTFRVERVGDVVRQSKLQIRPAWYRPISRTLPLLFQHHLELFARERGSPQVIEERKHRVCLSVSNVTGGQIGAQPARVDDADFRSAPIRGGERVDKGIGDEVTESRFGRSIIPNAV